MEARTRTLGSRNSGDEGRGVSHAASRNREAAGVSRGVSHIGSRPLLIAATALFALGKGGSACPESTAAAAAERALAEAAVDSRVELHTARFPSACAAAGAVATAGRSAALSATLGWGFLPQEATRVAAAATAA